MHNLYSTVTEYAIESSSRWLGYRIETAAALRSFEYNIARPLLQEDVKDSWASIRAKRNWSDLHYLLANPPPSSLQLEKGLKVLLERTGAVWYVNARDSSNATPLVQAIRSCPSAVDILLKAGANPHLISPLIDSVGAGFWNAVSPLVRAGADVNEIYPWPDDAISQAGLMSMPKFPFIRFQVDIGHRLRIE